MIEITVREFMEKVVTVRVRYKGNMQKGLKLIDRRVVPDKVKIFGYKSQITTINMIEGAEAVNLSELTESTSVKILLKKEEGIVRFVDTDTVDVFINVKNTNKSKQDDEQSKPGNEN
ncbi:MAG: YbbR-like domain-containing protein [bacterium]|nr:YbbR-like domain-containing protein [bacterium]